MMAARNTLLLIGLSALLAGCFDRDKPSGKIKYDDTTQSTTGSSYDSDAADVGDDGMGSNEPIPPQDSTPVALRAEVDENWPPPKFKPVTYKAMSARRLSYAGQIMRVANANGVEVELAHAIITQESVYKLKARSDGVGAMGLMQLMPDTARRWQCYQPYDAECNLNAGNRYLRFLADRYNGNIRTIAAGYNAGEGTADSYLHGTRLKGKNSGIKTPNGVPLASFAYTPKQRARCPSNNWHPTPDCEGQTFDYVRSVLGYYLTYKQHPELIGKTVEPAPSAVAHRQGRI